MIVDKTNTVVETKNSMTGSPRKYYTIPSDVTVESTATDPRGIPESLLAAVGQTEKSFEDELNQIRASMYLPTKYTTSNRSNLHKQLSAKIPEETDRLLGTLTSPINYVGHNDDISLTTDEQSHSSKITFGSETLDVPLGGAMPAKTIEVENAEARIIVDKPKPEVLFQQDDSTGMESEISIPIEHSNCENLKMEIHKNLKMHRLAADYFKFRNFLFFQAPQALLAMASAMMAFMGAAEVFESTAAKQIVTLAGCCSALVVVLQTLSGYCSYGMRASMHDGTTIYLRDLDDDLTLLMSKLRKSEITEKNREEKKSQPLQQNVQITEDTYESLQNRYRHSLKGCKSDVPTQITEAFSEIDSFILLSRTTSNRKYLEECGMFESQKFRGITLKSYDRLASNMVGYVYWPLKIPCPKTLVKMTIDETRSDLHQMSSFWETPPPREESSMRKEPSMRKESSMPCLPYATRNDAFSKFVAL